MTHVGCGDAKCGSLPFTLECRGAVLYVFFFFFLLFTFQKFWGLHADGRGDENSNKKIIGLAHALQSSDESDKKKPLEIQESGKKNPRVDRAVTFCHFVQNR